MSIRTVLEQLLKTYLPKRWRIVPTGTNLDTLATTVVQLKQRTIRRLPEAPRRLQVEFVATVISPHRDDIAKAEHDLDQAVIEVLTALDKSTEILWDDATKVVVDNQYLGYDITLRIHSKPS